MPVGEYTFCIEFFNPQVDLEWAISTVSSSVNINQYHTKHFPNQLPPYSRTIVHTHKIQDHLDASIFVDILPTNNSFDFPSNAPAHLVIYGVKGSTMETWIYKQIWNLTVTSSLVKNETF